MSRTTGIFEMLNTAQSERKQVDALKEELENLRVEYNRVCSSVAEVTNRLSMLQDIIQSKAKQEDLQNINLKFHNMVDELKKSFDVENEVKKSIDELKKKFLDIDEYDKDINNIKLCLEKYVKNFDNSQKLDDERLKTLEDKSFDEERIKLLEEKINQLELKNFFETPRKLTNQPVSVQGMPSKSVIRPSSSSNIVSNIRTSKST